MTAFDRSKQLLIEKATVDWIPPRVFTDTLTWQVIECLTRCGVPQPIAVVRQGIGDLLLRVAALVQHPLNTIMTLRDSGITRPRQLEGKKLGMPGLPSDEATRQGLS